MESFFFIPANDKYKLSKAKTIKSDNIIFDLEDSILESELEVSLENIIELDLQKSFWIRIPNDEKLWESDFLTRCYSITNLSGLIIPKITNKINFKKIFKKIQNFDNLIFLIENPRMLLEAFDAIDECEKLHIITGLALGSHDYAAEMGIKHEYENLHFALNLVVNISKSFNLKAIDIASMNIKDERSFKDECLRSFNKGFDSKFLLHPLQLEWFNEIAFYSVEEIAEAKYIKSLIKDDLTGFPVIKYNGKIFEKPHLNRINKILKYITNTDE